MNTNSTLLLLGCALALTGCPSSRTPTSDVGPDSSITLDEDAYLAPDAPSVDAGPPDAFVPPPMCGNRILEAGEQCDDGNTMAGDGCTACERDPYCGDRTLDPGELCDDGNNLSGDGCRSDCRSNERCGNGVLDLHRGEVCDGSPGCSTDCRMIATCGNGMMDPGEQCDDSNTARWDGCGPDCRTEVSASVGELTFLASGMGCDYSLDGRPDNAFGQALGAALPLLNMFAGGGGPGGGGGGFLLSFMGLDDPSAVDDMALRTAWLQGSRAPSGSYTVNMASLRADGLPISSLESSIRARMLSGGPEDIDVPLGFLPITLGQGRIRGTTMATAGAFTGLTAGMLCGGIRPGALSGITATLIESLGSSAGFPIMIGDPCDGSTADPTLADMLVAGGTLAIIPIVATQPDIDIDGDGLETYRVVRTGPARCQPVVTECIDGDGTVIRGRNCYDDPRMQDGLSSALSFTARRVDIRGVR